jgi:hypothetical protein
MYKETSNVALNKMIGSNNAKALSLGSGKSNFSFDIMIEEVKRAPLEDVPLFLSHDLYIIREIAKGRLGRCE